MSNGGGAGVFGGAEARDKSYWAMFSPDQWPENMQPKDMPYDPYGPNGPWKDQGGYSTGSLFSRGGPGRGMGGLQVSGEGGIGAGIQSSFYESDWVKSKHYGKDLRAMAPQWVPQMLESTPEAQLLFNEQKYMGMVEPLINQAVGETMGGFRTSMENVRRGIAARGMAGSTGAMGINTMMRGQAQAGAAGLRTSQTASAKLGRVHAALQYRQGIVGLGLGTAVPPHQYPAQPKPGVGGQIIGAVAGAALGAFAGGAGTAAAGGIFGTVGGG